MNTLKHYKNMLDGFDLYEASEKEVDEFLKILNEAFDYFDELLASLQEARFEVEDLECKIIELEDEIENLKDSQD